MPTLRASLRIRGDFPLNQLALNQGQEMTIKISRINEEVLRDYINDCDRGPAVVKVKTADDYARISRLLERIECSLMWDKEDKNIERGDHVIVVLPGPQIFDLGIM
jgi:hypothetical protein